MTEAGRDEEPGEDPASATPLVTGNRIIDAALAELTDIDRLPVDDRLQRLAAAHEVLAGVLDSSRTGAIPMPNPEARPQ